MTASRFVRAAIPVAVVFMATAPLFAGPITPVVTISTVADTATLIPAGGGTFIAYQLLFWWARFSLSPLIAICGSAQSCCVRASAADCPFNFLQNRANHANRCAVLIGKRFDGQIMNDEIIKTQP